jgi:hypothetical protein
MRLTTIPSDESDLIGGGLFRSEHAAKRRWSDMPVRTVDRMLITCRILRSGLEIKRLIMSILFLLFYGYYVNGLGG